MEEQEKKPREFWFTLFRKGEERPLWHPELEIVFLMKGTGKIYFMENVYSPGRGYLCHQ